MLNAAMKWASKSSGSKSQTRNRCYTFTKNKHVDGFSWQMIVKNEASLGLLHLSGQCK